MVALASPRNRLRPVPLVVSRVNARLVCSTIAVWLAATAVWLAMSATARAHEPGLSALDIYVNDAGIAGALSLSAPDVLLVKGAIADLARDAIRIDASYWQTATIVDSVVFEDGAARASLSFTAGAGGSGWPSRLSLTSDIPRRLARGHRQIVTVRAGDQILAEKLLDATARDVTVDLASNGRGGGAAPDDGVTWRLAAGMLTLGVGHILGGVDHLVFVAGLLLASRGLRDLAVALTAFTAAHSITLALAATGVVRLPPAIIEPLIAASIAWIGIENLVGPPRRPRWLLVFAFGLIHGFGFAGAFTELGARPALATATALLSFNAGVEGGQLALAALMWPMVLAVRARPRWHSRLTPFCSASIALAGGYWLIQRLS